VTARFALLLPLLLPAAATASPLFELAGGVLGGGGLSGRAVEAGAASAYFNPAFLPDAAPGFDLGLFVLSDQIGVRLRGRPSPDADVPVDSVNAERPGGGRYPQYGLPTVWLDQGRAAEPPDAPLRARPRQRAGSGHNVRLYQAIGFARTLFAGRVGLGLYALLPYRRFTGAAAFYSDEREQYFSNSLHPELYADRLTATSLSFGLGARLSRRLSVGAALTLGLRTQAATPTYLADVGRFGDILVDAEVGVNVALAPHFGAVYRPGPHTRLTATAHTPQKLEVATDFSFLLANGIEQSAAIRFTHAYLPWTVALGAAHDLLHDAAGTLTLSATALLALWSRYLDRHSERPHPAYAWFDTFSGVAGLRYQRGAARTFLDVAYHPSPVPDQTGRTSYVDNDRLGASAGFDLRGDLLGGSLRAGLQVQAHRLLPRETTKLPPSSTTAVQPSRVIDEVPDDAVLGSQPLPGRAGLQTNNPGWPGFSSAGWILGASAHLTLAF
jgi:long-chain fatty acid transport protein